MFLNPWYGGAPGGGPGGTLGVGPPSLEGVVTHEEALDSLESNEDFVQQSYIGRASPLPIQQSTQGRASPALSSHSDGTLQGRASPLLGRGSPLSRCASPVVRQGSPAGLVRVGSGGSGSGGRNSPALHHPVSGVVDVTTTVLQRLNGRLREGWTAHATPHGRLYYCNHGSGTSSWLPPLENWDSSGLGLPYGWEASRDKDNKQYFINHLNKTTTYEDPRKDYQEEPPQEREYELTRDTEMGFGFVAGSEKPVIVRFVTEGGPSADLLMPGDQILTINGEDVKTAPRDHVIQLVRKCKDKVTLTVTQPPLDNSARKSALLSAAKKQRLKNNPSRVRFAESVDINNGSPSSSPSNFNSSESTTPFMPNVLKVFLENGQTKSFKYDSSTTVGDVLESLHIKLGIKCPEHFSLVVEHVKSLRRNKLTILDPKEALSMIAARPGAQHLRCLYRVTFVPRDAYILLRKDSMAFEYLYLQVNNHPVWCTQFTSHQRRTTPLRYNTVFPLNVGCTRCSKFKSSNGMINIVNGIQEFGVYLSRSPFKKIGRKQNLFPSYSSTSSFSSKVFCMLSSALTQCASFIFSAYASGVSYVSSGLVNNLLSHDTQKPACLFKWSIALICLLPTHICMVRPASSLIFTSAVPKKQNFLSLYHMPLSERLHAKDFSTRAPLYQKEDETNPIKDKVDKLKSMSISKWKSSADSLKKLTPSKEEFENLKPVSKVLSDSIDKVGKIDMKNLKSMLNNFSGVKLSPEKKEEIKSFWEDMKKGNVKKSFSNISLRTDIKSEGLKNWKSITDVEKWKYYWKNWKREKEIPKLTSNEFLKDNVNTKSPFVNKTEMISNENAEKVKTSNNNQVISNSVNKVNEAALKVKDSLDQKIKSNNLVENANKIIPSESLDKLKTYIQKKELMGQKAINENKSLKERFTPSFTKVGKGVWTHRKYLYYLYHFSFIISIYRSVKKGVKWIIGLTLGTILYKNSNLITKKFDKFKSLGQFLVQRSYIKRIALLTKKLFRFNFFVNLFKRIFKKK